MVLVAPLANAATLHINISGPDGRPLAAQVEIRGGTAMYQCPGALRNGKRPWQPGRSQYAGSFDADGPCDTTVPPGHYNVIAEHGLEFERAEAPVDVSESADASVNIRLKRWIDMAKLGWRSGDFHIHRPPDEVAQLARTEGLDVSVVFTVWNKDNYWKHHPVPSNPVVSPAPNQFISLMNIEDERQGGAWMLHGLQAPLQIADAARWYPPGIKFIREAMAARKAGQALPWFDCEKPIWWEVPVVMALSPCDSMGVVHNHIYQYGFEDWDAWGRPRDKNLYPGINGLLDYSMQLYYRYLNLGFHLPPTAGTASGVKPAPVGYNRIYVKARDGYTLDDWYAALRKGGNFVTNGPILFVDRKGTGKNTAITVDARAREDIDRIEVIANGKVLGTKRAPDGAREMKVEFPVDATRYSWAAVRCFLKTTETLRFGHSSPIYLEGKYDARDDARYFVEWIDDLIAHTEADPKRFATEDEKQEVLNLYREARKFYEHRE